MGSKHGLSIVEIIQVDPSDYKSLYYLSVDIDGVPTGVLIGKKETTLGIDVISGGDILRFVDSSEDDIYAKIRKAIKECVG